jgi:hypothetical protein
MGTSRISAPPGRGAFCVGMTIGVLLGALLSGCKSSPPSCSDICRETGGAAVDPDDPEPSVCLCDYGGRERGGVK